MTWWRRRPQPNNNDDDRDDRGVHDRGVHDRGVHDRGANAVPAVGDYEPQALPRPAARTLAEDWLRTLTISSAPGMTPDQALALIAQVNQPKTLPVRIRTPLPPDDAQALQDSLAWYAEVRSRQAGVHLLIESTLIGWLAEATGENRAAIIQRLALAVEQLLPPLE